MAMEISKANSAKISGYNYEHVKEAEGNAPRTEATVNSDKTDNTTLKDETQVAVQSSEISGEQAESQQRQERQLKNAIEHANSTVRKMHGTTCEFSYHEDTKRVSIKVFDKETKEVIREIPPEETLDLVAKIWDLAGIIVDEKR